MTKMQHDDDFKFPTQHQPEPGLQSKMSPQLMPDVIDLGERKS